ncbi:hypothetical protein [Glutamicibacter protophormiae]|uniref:hypothetical protein n=1 Tax=Glutamicibacter protophormiae TaxID=37930 RepID=UPI003A940ABE
MDNIKSPGMALLKIAGWLLGGGLLILFISTFMSISTQIYVQAAFLFCALPLGVIFGIVGFIMHLSFRSKIQIIQSEREWSSRSVSGEPPTGNAP